MWGFFGPAALVYAFSETLKDWGHEQFHERKTDVENHCHDNDRADGNVPVGGNVIVLALKQEQELLWWKTFVKIEVENYDD